MRPPRVNARCPQIPVLVMHSPCTTLTLRRTVRAYRYHQAYYHCLVTATTVGYGDVTIATREGKIVAIFHILFSVSLLGSLIGEVFELMKAREDQLKRAEMLKKRLDPELIKSLDKDGAGVDKLEFVTGMLIKLELVNEADVEPYIKQFDTLDADGSGVLTAEDLEKATQDMKSKADGLKKRGRKGSQGGAAPPSDNPAPSAPPKEVNGSAPSVEVEVAVRRGEAGLGIQISQRNKITEITAGGTAEVDCELHVNDIVVAVDGQRLFNSQGAMTARVKDAFAELPKQPVHQFVVKRSAAADAALKQALALRPPTTPKASRAPSWDGDLTLQYSAAFAWGAMGMPREQLPKYLDHVTASMKEAAANPGSPGARNTDSVAWAWGVMQLPPQQLPAFFDLLADSLAEPAPRARSLLDSPAITQRKMEAPMSAQLPPQTPVSPLYAAEGGTTPGQHEALIVEGGETAVAESPGIAQFV